MPTTALPKTVGALVQYCENAERTAHYEIGLQQIRDFGFWDYQNPEKPHSTNLGKAEVAELLLSSARLYGFSSVTKKNGQEIPKNFLTEANDIFTELGLVEKQVLCSNYLALSEWQVGALGEAEIWLQNALSLHLPQLNPARLHTFIVESLVNCTNSKYEEILSRLDGERGNFLNCGDSYLLGSFYANRGIAEKNVGDFRHALISQTAARDIFAQSGHHLLFAHAENNLGNLFRVTGEPDKALEHVNRALTLAKKIKHIKLTAMALDSLALISYDKRDYDTALKHATQAVAESEKTECYAQRAEFCETKIKVLLKLNKHRQALHLYADTMAFARTYAPTVCESLTAAIEGLERKEIKIAAEPVIFPCRLKFQSKPAGEVFALYVSTADYLSFGLLRDSLAIVEKVKVENGDRAVIQSGTGYQLGFFDLSFGIVGLEVGNDLELFSESEVEILGKVIGHCPNPPDADGYYQVVSFE